MVPISYSVDPFTEKYPQFSPFTYTANNPIRYVDPDGQKFVDFDENGNFIEIKKDNFWHNLFHGSQGRVIGNDGSVNQKFRFADSKHDVADIKSGIINKI